MHAKSSGSRRAAAPRRSIRTPLWLATAGLVLLAPVASFAKDSAEPARRAVVGSSQTIEIVPDLSTARRIAGESVWSETLTVEGAAFVKPRFVEFNLRPGDVLIHRTASGRVIEELRGQGPKDAGSFWGLSAFGDTFVLEFHFERPYDRLPFRVSEVMVGDPSMLEQVVGKQRVQGAKVSGLYDGPNFVATKSLCSPADFEDVLCYQDDADKWDNVFASVGVMTAGGTVSLWCSGSNVSSNNYLLTNHHCIADTAECSNSEFVFRYWRTGCNDGSPPTADWVGFRCDETVASSPIGDCDPDLGALDYSLNTVIGDPAATFGFVNPDPTPITSGEGIYIVQHPAGRPHEITHGAGADVVVDGHTLRYYDTLDTEGGSSGSPIFRESDDKLIGLHHCGGCSTPGVGNRGMLMSDIYPEIEDFLCKAGAALGTASATDLGEVSGNGDSVLDPGETWSFIPRISSSSCDTTTLGVAGDIAIGFGSAPVTLLDTTTTFGDIPAGGAALGTPVAFQVPAVASCAGSVVLDLVNVTADNGGPFIDSLSLVEREIGEIPVTQIAFEDFTSGIPGDWTIVDGGSGSQTWTTADPGGRGLLTPPFAIVDSDEDGSGNSQDEEMISHVIDASGHPTVRLRFQHFFRYFNGGGAEKGDVDVRSSATGGAWVNVFRAEGSDASGQVDIDITAHAAADLQIRFHYYDAIFDWYWGVDDIYVLSEGERTCNAADALFADDFEFGDWNAWSSVIP